MLFCPIRPPPPSPNSGVLTSSLPMRACKPAFVRANKKIVVRAVAALDGLPKSKTAAELTPAHKTPSLCRRPLSRRALTSSARSHGGGSSGPRRRRAPRGAQARRDVAATQPTRLGRACAPPCGLQPRATTPRAHATARATRPATGRAPTSPRSSQPTAIGPHGARTATRAAGLQTGHV